MKSKENLFFKILFLIAAIYDFILGILFFFFYKSIFNFLNIQIPDYPQYLQMSAAFVIAMGIGYYFVYRNMYRNIDLVKLGIVYKFAYSATVIYFYFINLAPILFLWFAILDIIFIIFFTYFLIFAIRKRDN